MGCEEMRRDNNQQKIALAVGIALSAGMFSIMPSAYGAPVHDANSGITNALPATAINQTLQTTGGVKTEVTGNPGNNIVAWKDFSVGKQDVVEFDGGAKTNNYLNVVTGAATSQIDGTITGGKEVYIVNPNGVIFGSDASVNVGSLYVSTEDINSAVNAAANMGSNPSAVLQAGTRTADVVNMGAIQATNVQVEGQNIRFLDSAKVTTDGTTPNTNVVLNANATGYAHVGNAAGTSAGYSGTNLTDDFKLIKNATNLNDAATAVNGGSTSANYMLAADIDMSTLATVVDNVTTPYNFTPIGDSTAYSGTFDGMFFEVQNLNVSTSGNAGLFGNLSGAHIYNLGIQNPTIVTTGQTGYAGGVAGSAADSDFTNVYVENGSVTARTFAGGLAGEFYGGTISSAYNTSSVYDKVTSSNSAGLVAMLGKTSKNTTIENAYNTGNAEFGIYRTIAGTLTLKHIYTDVTPAGNNAYSANITESYYLNNGTITLLNGSTTGDATAKDSYSNWDIGNDGTGNHVWRIYEGVSTPILTAFLKGTATAEYNYNYFASSTDTTATTNGLNLAGGISGANNGADVSATYNAQYLKVADSTGTTAGTADNVALTSNVTSSDITLNTAGIRNVSVDSSGNPLPQALISSGQHGYNIVGGNAIIKKRSVTVNANSLPTNINKEYDGTKDATAALNAALTAGGSSVSAVGLLANDSVSVTGITATYNDKNVGTNKTITFGGTPTLTGTSANNYDLVASSLSGVQGSGSITPRSIYIKLLQTTGFNKTYDGDTTVTASAAAAATNVTIDTTKGTNHNFVTNGTTTEDAAIDTSNVAINYNDKHAGSKTIDYTNITLTGNDKGNYQLVVENAASATGYDVIYDGSTGAAGSGSLQATGTITQRAIDPTSFQVKDTSGNIANASKTYDGTSAFNSTGYTLVSNATSSGNTGVVSGDSINFSIVNGQANFQDASGNNTSSATTSGLTTAATKVGYSITAAAGNSTTLLSDYTLNGSTLSNTGTYTVSGTGEIKKRTINVAVTNTNAIDKEYDGTTAVNDTNASVFGTGGYVDYVSGATANDKLTGNDGATITVSAAYDSKAAGARTIDYTVTINGTAAANYDLDGTGTITDKLLGTTTGANGTISPKNLSSSFTAVTKTYDGTTNVPTAGTGSLTGIISGDTVSLQSGYKAQFHSENVNGDANGQNWVDYTNLVLTGTDAGNYTIASTAKGAGSITALTLNQGDFSYTFAPITKEYDGTPALNNAASYITGVKVTSTGDVIKGTVGGQTVDYTGNVSGSFTSKDSNNSTAQTVNYALTIFADGTGNYTIPTTGIQDATTTTGTITPRTVVAGIASTALANTTKIYDATTDLVDSQGNVLSGDKVITFKTLSGGTGLASVDSNASTAVYKDQGGDTTKDAYAGQTKNILYTAAITTTDSSNYNIVGSSQQALPNNQLTGTGIINKRALTVTFGDTTKTYDGTDVVASDAAHILPTLGNKAPDGVALDVTKITGQYTGRTDNTAVGSNLDVSYGNLVQALGSFADNYTIANTGSGKGAITTLTLTNSNFKFDFNTITKEYDGSKSVAYTDRSGNTVTAESFIGDHYVDMNGSGTYDAGDVLLQGITATFAEYQDENSNGSTAQPVTYTLTLGNNLSNFNTSGLTNITTASGATLNYSNGVLTANTTGTITPRAVYASLSNTVTPSKTYDGNGSITQANVNSNVSVNGLLGTDGTQLDTGAINAAYVGHNFDAGTYADYVTYNVQLTGGNLSNYKLVGATGANYTVVSDSQGTLKGAGTIKQAPLTISFAGSVEKEYDGKADVLNIPDTTLSGFVNNESDDLDSQAESIIKGTYGTWDSTNGLKPDENVNRLPDNSVGFKGVVYQNIKAALADYVQRNSNTAARNYYIDLDKTAAADTTGNTVGGTVADTVYFKEALQKGKIKPLALAAGDIQEKWTSPITKEYDGNALVTNPETYLKLEATKTVNGTTQTINVPYTVLANNATYNGGKDVSTSGQGVTYKLSGFTAQALGNFDISQALADSYDIAKSGANAVYNSVNAAQPPTTSITPKVIGTGLTKTTGIEKIYDGNENADKTNAYITFSDILTADQGTVSAAVTDAYYADKTNGGRKSDASAAQGQGTNAYNVQYEFTLSGNSAGNYTLAGNSVQNTLTLTGTGDILKRKVYVDFATGMDTGIDKPYDGGTTVLPAYTVPSRFTLSGQNGDTGVLTTEQNIVQLANTISAAYQSPHVQRTTQGAVTTQDVTFSNFNLTATGSNYELTTADGTGELTGKGTITPLTVGVSIKSAPTKEYDGTTALDNAYNTVSNVQVDRTNLIGSDTINIGVTGADYADKNAASGTKQYTYQLNWDNGDYDLAVQQTAAGEIMTVTGYANGKVQGALSGTNGTITPRLLQVLTPAEVEKVYDGNESVTNAAYNVRLSNRIISGDNIGFAANGSYDNANAGNHVVTYNLGLTNNNYQLDRTTVDGQGKISRRTLAVTATPVSVNVGEAMPRFTGTVTGFVTGEQDNYSDFLNGISYKADAGVTTNTPGKYAVYGWYNGKTVGNLGLNYMFTQAPANATAFTVNYVDTGRNNPDTKITPTHNVYQQISKDKGSGFGDNAAAALEYVNKNGQVIGRENIDSGEIHDGSVSLGSADDRTSQDTSLANIGIAGGDIVNVDGADAAGVASIEVTDNGTTVNLEVTYRSETGAAGDKQAVAEITDMPAATDNSSAQIQNLDGRQEIVEQLENKDKDEEKKESEIAIESKSSQNDDEIELKIEGSGVKVA